MKFHVYSDGFRSRIFDPNDKGEKYPKTPQHQAFLDIDSQYARDLFLKPAEDLGQQCHRNKLANVEVKEMSGNYPEGQLHQDVVYRDEDNQLDLEDNMSKDTLHWKSYAQVDQDKINCHQGEELCQKCQELGNQQDKVDRDANKPLVIEDQANKEGPQECNKAHPCGVKEKDVQANKINMQEEQKVCLHLLEERGDYKVDQEHVKADQTNGQDFQDSPLQEDEVDDRDQQQDHQEWEPNPQVEELEEDLLSMSGDYMEAQLHQDQDQLHMQLQDQEQNKNLEWEPNPQEADLDEVD